MCCEDARKGWQEYLDDQLPSQEARAIESHLETCAACRAEFALLRQVDLALAMLPVLEEPAHFTAQVMAQVRATEARPVFRLRREDVMVSFAFAWTVMAALFAFSLLWLQDSSSIQVFLQEAWWTLLPELDYLWHMARSEPVYATWGLSNLCVVAVAAASAVVLLRRWPGRSMRRSW